MDASHEVAAREAPSSQRLFSRAIEVGFAGDTLRIVGREDSIAMKLYAGGPKHLSDAKQLLANDIGALNLTLLTHLAHRYGPDVLASLQRLPAE